MLDDRRHGRLPSARNSAHVELAAADQVVNQRAPANRANNHSIHAVEAGGRMHHAGPNPRNTLDVRAEVAGRADYTWPIVLADQQGNRMAAFHQRDCARR